MIKLKQSFTYQQLANNYDTILNRIEQELRIFLISNNYQITKEAFKNEILKQLKDKINPINICKLSYDVIIEDRTEIKLLSEHEDIKNLNPCLNIAVIKDFNKITKDLKDNKIYSFIVVFHTLFASYEHNRFIYNSNPEALFELSIKDENNDVFVVDEFYHNKPSKKDYLKFSKIVDFK